MRLDFWTRMHLQSRKQQQTKKISRRLAELSALIETLQAINSGETMTCYIDQQLKAIEERAGLLFDLRQLAGAQDEDIPASVLAALEANPNIHRRED